MMDNLKKKIDNLEKQLNIRHNRIKQLEQRIAEKDKVIKDHWDRIQSMRLTNRVKRLVLLTSLRKIVCSKYRAIQNYIAFKRKRAAIIRKFTSNSLEEYQDGPFISIIILNRNGLHHLKRLFKNFSRKTGYSRYEIIIVDNNSSDGSVAFLKSRQVKVIENPHNETFSVANNKAVKFARGELLLFLNNDVDPVQGWLGELANTYASFKDKKIGLIGSLLIYPYEKGLMNDLTVQHDGISFRKESFFFRPVNDGTGRDPLSIDKSISKAAAVTGACFIIQRNVFNQVEGFDEGYNYGYEDVDLCLKVRAAGYENYICRKSALFHYEYGTQREDKPEDISTRRHTNANLLTKKWYRKLYHLILKEKIDSNTKRIFSESRLNIGIITSQLKKVDLDPIMAKLNVDLILISNRHVPQRTDIVLVTDLGFDVTEINSKGNVIKVLWLANQNFKSSAEHFFSKYDIVLSDNNSLSNEFQKHTGVVPIVIHKSIANSDLSEYLSILIDLVRNELSRWISRTKVLIKVPIFDWENSKFWGDYHLALNLKKEFEKLQHPTSLSIYPEWFNGEDLIYDVVLVIRGIKRYYPRASHLNLMWNISHPDLVTFEEYQQFDHVFIASNFWTHHLKVQGLKNVSSLLQCTDPEIFQPPPKKESIQSDLLFVGNTRGVARKIIIDLLPTHYDLCIYGKKWKGRVDNKYVKGDYIDNRQLYRYYSGAKIVLNDHWEDMRGKGFVSNRIFDALSTEAVIISDEVDGLTELFNGLVFTYHTPEELNRVIENIFSNLESIRQERKGIHEFIKQNHSFEKRADQIIRILEQSKYLGGQH